MTATVTRTATPKNITVGEQVIVQDFCGRLRVVAGSVNVREAMLGGDYNRRVVTVVGFEKVGRDIALVTTEGTAAAASASTRYMIVSS